MLYCKSWAARIGNTWMVESPMAMESTEILDNWWLQPSVFALLFNKRLWMNQSRKSEIQASTTARAWSWDKVSSGRKKDRVGCHRHIHGHGHHHNIHIKPTNPFFKKNAYDLAFTLNIISLYFPENSEITDWNTTSKGGRGSEHCYLFTVYFTTEYLHVDQIAVLCYALLSGKTLVLFLFTFILVHFCYIRIMHPV